MLRIEPPREVRWVLFDAVGTLIYPQPSVAEAYGAIARQFGLEIPSGEIATRFKAALAREFCDGGLSRPPTNEDLERARWQRIVAAVLLELPDASHQPFEMLWQHFGEPSSWRLFDDVSPTLAGLAHRGFELAIASNFDSRLQGVARGLPPLAACSRTFVSSEVGFSKPDPRFFTAVQRELSVQPREILLVGDDRVNDYEGALAAGWQAVLIER